MDIHEFDMQDIGVLAPLTGHVLGTCTAPASLTRNVMPATSSYILFQGNTLHASAQQAQLLQKELVLTCAIMGHPLVCSHGRGGRLSQPFLSTRPPGDSWSQDH